MGMTVRYADSQQGLSVSPIAQWDRGDIPNAIMSSSSGPKDYLKNNVFFIFEQRPEINRVVLVRSAGALFFLMRDSENCWFDVSGKQVVKG